MSTDSCPIKVVDTDPSKSMRADEIATETAKPSKVNAIVAVMSIYCRKNAVCRVPILEMRSLLATKQKKRSFWRNFPTNQEDFFRKRVLGEMHALLIKYSEYEYFVSSGSEWQLRSSGSEWQLQSLGSKWREIRSSNGDLLYTCRHK